MDLTVHLLSCGFAFVPSALVVYSSPIQVFFIIKYIGYSVSSQNQLLSSLLCSIQATVHLILAKLLQLVFVIVILVFKLVSITSRVRSEHFKLAKVKLRLYLQRQLFH